MMRQVIDKPSLNEAKKLMESETVLWNAGVCAGHSSTFIALFKRHWPVGLSLISRYLQYSDTMAWNQAEKISFDYAVLEKMNDIELESYSDGWSDLGDWRSIEPHLPPIQGGRGVAKAILVEEGDGNVIYSPDKPVAVLGLDNIVVVDTPDGLLVMNKNYSQKVRQVADYFKS